MSILPDIICLSTLWTSLYVEYDMFMLISGPRVHPHSDENDQRVEARGQPPAVHQGQLQPAARLRAEADAQGRGDQEGQGNCQGELGSFVSIKFIVIYCHFFVLKEQIYT